MKSGLPALLALASLHTWTTALALRALDHRLFGECPLCCVAISLPPSLSLFLPSVSVYLSLPLSLLPLPPFFQCTFGVVFLLVFTDPFSPLSAVSNVPSDCLPLDLRSAYSVCDTCSCNAGKLISDKWRESSSQNDALGASPMTGVLK